MITSVTQQLQAHDDIDVYLSASSSTTNIATPPTLPPSTTNPPSINRALYTLRITSAGPPPRFLSPRTPRESTSPQDNHPSHIRHHVCRAGPHQEQEEGQPEPVSIPHPSQRAGDARSRDIATSATAISAYTALTLSQ
jgi:hypothetical protein